MYDGCLLVAPGESGLELKNAAGVAGGYDVGFKLRNHFGFAVAKRFRGIGLHEIVDAG